MKLYEVYYIEKCKKAEKWGIIGIYSTEKRAKKVIKKIKKKGYGRKGKFYIGQELIDDKQTAWDGGYFTIYYDTRVKRSCVSCLHEKA